MKAVSAFDLEGPSLVTHSLHFCQVRTSRSLQCQYKSHDSNTGSHDHNTGSHDHNTGSHDHNTGSHDHNTGSHDHNTGSHDHNTGSHDHNTGSHNVDIPDVLMVGGASAECK